LGLIRARKSGERNTLLFGCLDDLEDVRVTRVGDGEAADAEELSAGGSEISVASVVVVEEGLREHAVVLDLRLSQSGTVLRQENHLSLANPDGLHALSVPQKGLA